MFTHEDLAWLAQEREGRPCVSILMPTDSQAHNIEKDTIRYKNLLRQARDKLGQHGWRKPRLDAFFKPAERLLQDETFWRKHADGLAVFISEDEFKWFRTPLELKEEAVLAELFHITPLISVLNRESRYFVLALSQKEARLIDCTSEGTRRLELPEASKGLEGTVAYDAPRKEVQFHTGTGEGQAGGKGRRAAVFHGSGGVLEKEKELIQQYFRIVDKDASKALKDQSAPLILAGVDYLFPIYREVNSYSNLLKEGIEGNPDEASDRQLGQKGWEIIRPKMEEAIQRALAEYGNLAANGRATTNLEKIVPQAIEGRVQRLFVAHDAHCWGGIDQGGQAYVHDQRQPGDLDLIDLCALRTLLHGQPVYAIEQERLPEGKPMAAIFYH
ncbi:MAG TPA: hypothetical protein VLU25_07305 [Acidobacteriota bacterium]|nr:hypothetical protein [Acidobacteriota bacterium]